jgi:hypothetical protein
MYEAISSAGIRDTSMELAEVEPILQSWRRRCEAQLDMIGVCRSNGVFEMFPSANVAASIQCPFRILDDYATTTTKYYVSPGCIVYVASGISTQPGLRGAFYDPCRLLSSPCSTTGSIISIQDLINSPNQKARLPFDPRATGARDALGRWPLIFHALNPDSNTRQASAR